MMAEESIGKRIAAARSMGLGRKVTQAELAHYLGVTPQAVSGWERDENDPETEKLHKIASFLNVGMGWLLGEPDMPPQQNDRVGVFVRLMDKVPAGKLSLPMSQLELDDLPLLFAYDLDRGDYIALTVEGDSMDRMCPEGSIIFVNKSDRTLIAGKPYVFSHRGKATFKLWRPDPPRLQPYSTNPANEPIYIRDKREAEGMVVGRVRKSIQNL